MPEIDLTDITLRAKNGDTAAAGEIYEQCHQDIYWYLFYRVGNSQTAEDLTAEVFLRMLRGLPNYQPQGKPVEAWLFQIARNLAIDHYRSDHHNVSIEVEENQLVESEVLHKKVENSLTGEKLRLALDHLSADQRDVIILRFVLGMPIAEAARTINRSQDAVKALQRRGLLALRDLLISWEVSYA
ncbi:RNA polymerase sigma factor, sigma-70 family [Longilinea arvoryzae]|uniref:RNA polymerase sigma factor, sigma-70 family n=1 Tax=Longilinea arvoryzae TaxID=360412 RepID=A0A0S7B9N7_9CHLR|nr:sigma-70 family RNA polymerase sigma factor [Longilinea arvoryzae]GAP14119.1 RNA polymerase sigma factor, sigma-70 family [Longilinea arvoryzae]